jgi:hypothetical protein
MLLRHLCAGLALTTMALATAGCCHSHCRPSCASPAVSAAPPCCPGPGPCGVGAVAAPPPPVQAYSPPQPVYGNGYAH